MDPADSSSDVNIASSDEPSSSPARYSGNSSSDVNVVSSGDEPSSSATRGSTSSGRSVDVASGYTCDELIFQALYKSTENHDGNGLDINGIFDYHRGRHRLPENFMNLLRYELRKLVIEGQIEKVGNIYKIPIGAITPEGSNPTQNLDTESSAMPQELPRTSDDVPSMAQELPSTPIDESQEKVNEAVRLVAVAEDCEIQAKEAVEQADRSVELLHESRKNELLALEISRRCARGEKVFLR